ncbi:MAG: hypothetical protein GEU75_06310 [Dehalococcoidia bacterium]|nr:hypothetical protein [Dehalococcoidia bacterium]
MATDEILAFLHLVWGEREALVALPFKDARGRWKEPALFEWPYAYSGAQLHVAKVLRDAGDLYFTPVKFDEPSRTQEHALPTRWLWSDLDEADPRKIKPRPTIAWETSPGRYQALWRLTKTIDAAVASELSRRIAYKVGADHSGWDVTQLLRPPGSVNHKRAEPFTVSLLWSDGPRYRPPPVLPEPSLVRGTASIALPDVEPNRKRRPPTQLNILEDAIWLGRRAITTGEGKVDRSRTLWAIGCLLAKKGLAAEEIAEHLHERDISLFGATDAGPKYVDKPEQYLIIAEKAAAR